VTHGRSVGGDLRRRARQLVRVTGFGAVTAAMLPAYTLRDALLDDASRDPIRDRWIAAWSSALLRLFAVRVEADEPSAKTANRGRLVIANHRSTLDIAILLRAFGGHMVSRADLARWPLLGAAARKVGTVFVDRADPFSGATAVRGMRDLLKRGRTVIVFAEGTTFPDDVVRPFHPGAFVAATHCDAEIVPVGLAYPRDSGAAFVDESFGAHLARMSAAAPSRVVMRIGSSIVVDEKSRSVKLRDRTHAAVQALVDEARVRCDADGYPPPTK
jgi:1-acyl-sn-glycerol-3-phosphate acyltransferase